MQTGESRGLRSRQSELDFLRDREEVGARLYHPWPLYPPDANDTPYLNCDNQMPHGIAKYLMGGNMATAEEDHSPTGLLQGPESVFSLKGRLH